MAPRPAALLSQPHAALSIHLVRRLAAVHRGGRDSGDRGCRIRLVSSPRPLEGKRVLLTGASRGIGRAIAGELSAGGARLALVGRDRATLEPVAAACGAHHFTLVADLENAAEVEQLVDRGQA